MSERSDKTRIEFEFEGKHYRLEYTFNALKKLEKSGVKLAHLDEMIFTAPEILFRGAFYANHPDTPVKTINQIYKALKRSAEDEEPEYDEDGRQIDGLTTVLAEMISEVVEEANNRQGNVSWKVTR